MAGDRGCGCQDKPAGLNSFGTDQLVRQLTNAARGATEQDHLQASPFVQVDVSGRDDLLEMAVLQFGQALGDPAGVVIVNQGDHTHRLAVFPVDHFLDQRIPHQAPDRLAPVGIAMLLAILVEPLQQLAPDRNTEADEWLFHFGLQWAVCVEPSLAVVAHKPPSVMSCPRKIDRIARARMDNVPELIGAGHGAPESVPRV